MSSLAYTPLAIHFFHENTTDIGPWIFQLKMYSSTNLDKQKILLLPAD